MNDHSFRKFDEAVEPVTNLNTPHQFSTDYASAGGCMIGNGIHDSLLFWPGFMRNAFFFDYELSAAEVHKVREINFVQNNECFDESTKIECACDPADNANLRAWYKFDGDLTDNSQFNVNAHLRHWLQFENHPINYDSISKNLIGVLNAQQGQLELSTGAVGQAVKFAHSSVYGWGTSNIVLHVAWCQSISNNAQWIWYHVCFLGKT